MKTFKVKPAEAFELEFSDGKKIEMVFNTRSMSILAEQINNRKITLTSPDFIASIIYAGAKACNPDFTEEEGDALYVQLEESCPDALNGIIEEYCTSTGINTDTLKKNMIMKLM